MGKIKNLVPWVALDICGVALALYASSCLRILTVPHDVASPNVAQLALIEIATLALFGASGLYIAHSRYLGIRDVARFITCVTISSLCYVALNAYVSHTFEHSLVGPGIFYFVCTSILGSFRLLQRLVEVRNLEHESEHLGRIPQLRTLVIGAGDAGEMIISESLRKPYAPFKVVGLLDDNIKKHGLTIHGVKVLGKTNQVGDFVRRLRVDQVLIAMPSAEGSVLRHITELCQNAKVKTLSLPSVTGMIVGAAITPQARGIDIADLLQRPPTPFDPVAGMSYIAGQTIMITGAGGSIGSELVRQIAKLHPKRLILLGSGENSIFEIEQMLIQDYGLTPIPVIADVRNRARLDHLFDTFRPDVVFHAAAHKHVPLMEANPVEAVRNNCIGTLNVVELSAEYNVKHCIFVSTDKAVNPSSVMGASKRLSERIVVAHTGKSATEFAIVRFGNVLGSRGSLIPCLKNQIMRGGPVRITHPEMTRFFMTIPEAAQLIVQAGAMGKEGEIFILDMGDPVSIKEIAYDVIRLHGHIPEKTMKVVFTGTRPGEKLHEELAYSSEELLPTDHNRIRMVSSSEKDALGPLLKEVRFLEELCKTEDSGLIRDRLLNLATSPTFVEQSHVDPKTIYLQGAVIETEGVSNRVA